MKVLLVGGGGREHALAWALARSPLLSKLWAAPGNAGIAELAECVPIAAEDVAGLVSFARDQAVDLVVAGPEAPLTAGLADACAAAGIRCFGPSAAAARLEGSKAFAREVADAAGVPGPRWRRFDDPAAARAHLREQGAPIVVKADGLAAGKGVVVAGTVAEAEAAVSDIMESRVHGAAAGAAVVVEECLVGEEVSFFALCDGEAAVPLGAAQDHKRVGEGDTGPNTGGMGAYSPPPGLHRRAARRGDGAHRAARPWPRWRGAARPSAASCSPGLMLTATGPRLIEFNVRFGDPECQALMLRLRSDLLEALLAACDGRLAGTDLRWSDAHSLVVVMAARGYPGAYAQGHRDTRPRPRRRRAARAIFHAGTSAGPDGAVVANGGRVLGVGATGSTLREARDAAYRCRGGHRLAGRVLPPRHRPSRASVSGDGVLGGSPSTTKSFMPSLNGPGASTPRWRGGSGAQNGGLKGGIPSCAVASFQRPAMSRGSGPPPRCRRPARCPARRTACAARANAGPKQDRGLGGAAPVAGNCRVGFMGAFRSGPTSASPAPPSRWHGRHVAMNTACPRRSGASAASDAATFSRGQRSAGATAAERAVYLVGPILAGDGAVSGLPEDEERPGGSGLAGSGGQGWPGGSMASQPRAPSAQSTRRASAPGMWLTNPSAARATRAAVSVMPTTAGERRERERAKTAGAGAVPWILRNLDLGQVRAAEKGFGLDRLRVAQGEAGGRGRLGAGPAGSGGEGTP